MALRSTVVTVGSTPTPLIAASRTSRDVAVTNSSGVTVYIGDKTVTSSTGFPVAAGATMAFDDLQADSLPHAVTASGTAAVNVLEVNL